ncbi:hypothetical protein NN561_017869 [Cricetulus griseus]
MGAQVSRLLLRSVLEQPLAQVTRSLATPLRRLQPGRGYCAGDSGGYCAGDSGGDPGQEHCGEVSEAWRFLPGPWPGVVTGCRDRGAGPRPRLPVPTPAPSGAPHQGRVVRRALGRLGAERWREPPSRFRRGQRAGQCHREARSSLRPRAGGRPCRLRLFPRAHRGGARPLANRRERGGCSALRSEDGPRGRTARSASAGYVGDTRCPRARSRLLSALFRSPLGRGEERRVFEVGGSVRATGSH